MFPPLDCRPSGDKLIWKGSHLYTRPHSETRRLVRVEGKLNGAKYKDILNENLFHSA